MNILIVCGPTATGKTQLARTLAQQFNGELISADSRQVYIGMDIITGKDKPNQPSTRRFGGPAIKTWLYDVVSPDQEFSVAHYAALARDAIVSIHNKGKLPILVGGTGLYIDAVVKGIQSLLIPKHQKLRDTLASYSREALQKRLQNAAPDMYALLNYSDKQNPRRLIRKIEIAEYVKNSIKQTEQKTVQYQSLWIGLKDELSQMQKNISARVSSRLEQGAVEEVKNLLQKGYTFNNISMQAIGYKEWYHYIQNPSPEEYEKAKQLWILHEFQYAKRQLTWFKKNPDIHWFTASDPEKDQHINQLVKSWYNTLYAKENRNIT